MPGTRKSRWWKIPVIIIGSAAAAFILLWILVVIGTFGRLPSRTELSAIRNEEATLVLAADSTIIGKVFDRDRTNVSYADLPAHLIDALVATEDRRFFDHRGVDLRSYLRALFHGLFSSNGGGGGSTISQQIIKNLYGRPSYGPLTMPVSKVKEAILAQRLEEVYDKEGVLTLYLNTVPFGENVYGIESAARRYFSKAASRLNVQECATLVGLLKANTRYNPRLYPEEARARRDQVLRLMVDRGSLTTVVADSLTALPIELRYTGIDALDLYGYFVDRVADEARVILAERERLTGRRHELEKDGLRIHTTLDPELQHIAMEAMKRQLAAMQPRLDAELRQRGERTEWEKNTPHRADPRWKANTRSVKEFFDWSGVVADTMGHRDSLWHYHRLLNGAVLMMEPGTGSVRAWVGGNHHRYLPYDLVRARRQIASTIKPVLYAAALDMGMQPCDYLTNKDSVYAELEGWHPHNFEEEPSAQVALWYALVRSINLPTLDLYFRVGPATIGAMMASLGLPEEGAQHPALAMGAADISLEEIVSAYTSFAAQGRLAVPRLIERITDAGGRILYDAPASRGHQAMSVPTATQITAMLQRAVNEGTGSTLRTRFGIKADLAGKTGTSQGYTDAWFVGYTSELVIGTWVGAHDPAMHFHGIEGTGARLALPIVGHALAGMERSSRLKRRYLRPFRWDGSREVDMRCRPTRSGVGIDDLFEGLFGRGNVDRRVVPKDSVGSTRKEGFLKRLFKRKK
jgi:penicillin-binding protein 1A